MKLLGFLLFPLLCAASGFNGYVGDSNPYRTAAMAVDSSGNSYFTGGRVFGNLLDVFITKVDPTGHLVFTTTASGKGSDTATSIAVDASGDIWVGGYTTSIDFPLRNALQSQPCSCGSTAFVMELSPDGAIVFSSYFGGLLGASAVNGIAVDASGNAYLTGVTSSRDFAVTAGMPTALVSATGLPSTSGAFVAKIAASGSKVVYSGLIAGSTVDCQGGSSCFLSPRYTIGVAIAVDASGNAYITGNTNTTNLPVTPGAMFGIGLGPFLTKINASGSGLGYLTYLTSAPPNPLPLATSGFSSATAIAVDAAGNAYVTGSTGDANFPSTANAYQKMLAGPLPPNAYVSGPTDVFAAKLASNGSAYVWATYLGGKGNDAARSISVDTSGNVWLAGTTQSPDFPNASGWALGGDFLAELNASGSALPFSARYPSGMVSTGVAVDGGGTIHTAGLDGLASAFTPSGTPSPAVYGIANAAAGDLTGRVVPGEVISIYGPHIGPATPVAFTVVNGFVPTTLGGVQVMIGGHPAPLLYVSDWQINAVVPIAIEGLTAADVQVTFNGNQTPKFGAVISPAEPGIFADGSGNAIFNPDGSVNSGANPAAPGSAVSMWVTGIDLGNTNLADGQIAIGAAYLAGPQWQVTVGTKPVQILYGGSAPELVNGIVQINFEVPPGGLGDVTLTIRNRTSPPVAIQVAGSLYPNN